MGIVLAALLTMGVLGVSFALGLAYASKRFEVNIDPRQEKVLDALPGANCGACGYPSCSGYAHAIVAEGAPPDLCVPGGPDIAREIGSIMDLAVEEKEPRKAVCRCNRTNVRKVYKYEGIDDCRAAALLHGGPYECHWACIGLGTCAKVCPFSAITVVEGLPVVDEEKCTGCGLCEDVCPHNLMRVRPVSESVHIRCENRDRGGTANKICKTSCIGCGKCVKVCPGNAIEIVDNLAQIDYDKCTSCGKCVEVCPHHCIYNFKEERILKGWIKDETTVEKV